MSCRATQRLPAANDIQWIIVTPMQCMDPIHVEKRGWLWLLTIGYGYSCYGSKDVIHKFPQRNEVAFLTVKIFFPTLHICLHPPTEIRINVVPSNQWEECLSYWWRNNSECAHWLLPGTNLTTHISNPHPSGMLQWGAHAHTFHQVPYYFQ